MNDVRIGKRAWHASAALGTLGLLWVATAAAQGDPLDSLDDEAPAEGEPPADGAPPSDAPPEDTPPAEEPPGDEGAAADGGVPEEVPREADAGVVEEVIAPTAEAESGGNDMVVTGSRMRRSNCAQPAAVQIMDRK